MDTIDFRYHRLIPGDRNLPEVFVDSLKPMKRQKLVLTDIADPTSINLKPNNIRLTPIMAEILDTKTSAVDLARAINAGLNIVKFKMAATTKAERIHWMSQVDKAADLCMEKKGHTQVHVATCMALKTFIKKTGLLDPEFDSVNDVSVKTGAEMILTNDKSYVNMCSPSKVFLDYPKIGLEIKVGQEVTIGTFGDIKMHCSEIIDPSSIRCIVDSGGKLQSLMTTHIRGLKHTSTSYLSKVDINFLQFCTQYQFEMLSVFYVQNGLMIRNIKRCIQKAKEKPLIFGGICDAEGLNNLDEIIKECDGIIIWRGYLEFELESKMENKIIPIQNWIAAKCQQAGKPVFLSGVLSNVLKTGHYSYSDSIDCSEALLTGITGFILRECTNMDNTITAVQILDDICCQTEPLALTSRHFWRLMQEIRRPVNAAEAAALSCIALSNQLNAKVIIVPTNSGTTARILLKFQPKCLIIAVCSKARVAKKMYTFRNVYPILSLDKDSKHFQVSENARVMDAVQFGVAARWLVFGDAYVTLQRSADNIEFCDTVKAWTVDITTKPLIECDGDDDEEDYTSRISSHMLINTIKETSEMLLNSSKNTQHEQSTSHMEENLGMEFEKTGLSSANEIKNKSLSFV